MSFKNYFIKFQAIDANDDYILRQVKIENDLEAYHEIYSDADVMKYYEGGTTVTDKERVKTVLNNQIKEFEKARIYSWTIADKKTDTAIGRILLSNFESNNKIANLGYFIGKKHWGKGIASAIISPVVTFGFECLLLERIYARVAIDNIGSWKALEKNGFVKEGLIRHSFYLPDGLCDCYMYSRLFTD